MLMLKFSKYFRRLEPQLAFHQLVYNWPGIVRERENVTAFMVNMMEADGGFE